MITSIIQSNMKAYSGSKVQAQIRHYLLAWYKTKIKDDKLRAKVTPNYDVGCKRMLPTERYMETLQMPNVELVTELIDRFDAEGIVSQEPE